MKNDFYGAISNLNYTSDILNLSFGGGINNYDGNHFGNVIWAKNYNNLSNGDRYYDNDGEKLDYNLFLKGSYYFSPALSVFGDLQFRGIRYQVNALYLHVKSWFH